MTHTQLPPEWLDDGGLEALTLLADDDELLQMIHVVWRAIVERIAGYDRRGDTLQAAELTRQAKHYFKPGLL